MCFVFIWEQTPTFATYRGADKSLAISHWCRGGLVGRKNFWIFLSGFQKLEQRAKKCIELRGEYVK